VSKPSTKLGLHLGHLAALGAFGAWGVLTVYWKALGEVPALSVVAQRLLWSLVFLWILLPLRVRWGEYIDAFRSPKVLGVHAISGALIGTNWLLFIWATLNERIVESSLGYFLSPLVIIAIGALVLKESLNKFQYTAIGLAATGLLLQIPLLNHFPWIALSLAVTFATYGLVRRKSPLGSLTGVAVETTFFLIPSVIWLSCTDSGGWSALTFTSPTISTLLILSGVVTAVPLLWFGYAARTVRFSTIGVIQFLAPSLQFALGVIVYHEPISKAQLLTYALIWLAVILYLVGSSRSRKATQLKAKEVH
jgi:chloramphenicol-sensitive protein RarD